MITMFCRYLDYYNSTSRVAANQLAAAPVSSAPLMAAAVLPAPAASAAPAAAVTSPAPKAVPETVETAPEPAVEPDVTDPDVEMPAMLAAQPEAEIEDSQDPADPEPTDSEAEAETKVPELSVPEIEAEAEPEITQEPEEAAEPDPADAEPEVSPEPEPVPSMAVEEQIPEAPEGMINVIFDLAGGILKEPEKVEAEETAEPSAEPDQVPVAESRRPKPQKYGERYVICCKIGEQIMLLPEPEQEGMEFLGWFCEEQAVTPDSKVGDQDLILTAKWKPVDPEE